MKLAQLLAMMMKIVDTKNGLLEHCILFLWFTTTTNTMLMVYKHILHLKFNGLLLLYFCLEPVRSFHGLSTNLYKASDYDKLSLSLLSPLPNEQDLAINVCILLSNENKHAIKLSKCPQILHHLLAHAGIFTHCKINTLAYSFY